MEFEIHHVDDYGNEFVSFHGRIDMKDMASLTLLGTDIQLLRSVDKGPATAADYLLALEMLFRRYAEQKGGV